MTATASEYLFDDELDGRVVRFEQECVLIPESCRAKRQIMVTKSYNLPFRRKRIASEGGEPEEDSPVLKVPVPRYVTLSHCRAPPTTSGCQF